MTCLKDPVLNPSEVHLFQRLYRHAAQELTVRGHLPPSAFFRAGMLPRLPGLKPGQVALAAVEMPGSDDGKDCVVEVLRQFARSADADMALLFLESWVIKPNEEEARYIKEHGQFLVRPSQHPQRSEIVFISISKPGGHNWSAWVEIRRDSNGRPSIPADSPRLEYITADGRFANILDGDGHQPSLS